MEIASHDVKFPVYADRPASRKFPERVKPEADDAPQKLTFLVS